MLDILFNVAGTVILLMILTFLIIKPQPAGNRITNWIITITGFVALLIIIRFIAHYTFSKRIKNLQIKVLVDHCGYAAEEINLKALSIKQVDAMFENIKKTGGELK